MPRKDPILNLPGFTIKKVLQRSPLVLEVYYRRIPRCPFCSGKDLRNKGPYWRKVRHESYGLRQIWLHIKAHKFYCRQCQRYFNQRFPGIQLYQRATERFKQQLYQQHNQGMSQTAIVKNQQLGKSTVERWYQQQVIRKKQEWSNQQCPKILGIDEHFFSRKKGYATTFCDLQKHRIYDISQGRAQADLAHYLKKLKGKERCKVICIDLSTTYKAIAKQHFPNALIVADRFHVIRLINQQVINAIQTIDPNTKYQRGLIAALRTKPHKLTYRRQTILTHYLRQHPMATQIYQFKNRLHRLLTKKTRNAKQCKKLIPFFLNMVQQLKQTPIKPLQTLGKTLYAWREEIVRMWRFTKNNGITEGFHRKMKLIQRRAYGFRNFDNYRLRVRVLCG